MKENEILEYIYANIVNDEKFYKLKLKIVEVNEITEKEYLETKDILKNYRNK